jgi:hypothetical protein
MATRIRFSRARLASFSSAVLLSACGGDGTSAHGPSNAAPKADSGSASSPSTALEAPAAGDGLQIVTPDFTLHPGDEVFKCYYTTIPSDTDVNIARFVSKMNKGSHHFILYQLTTATQPDGTLVDCGGGIGLGGGAGGSFTSLPKWVYASSQTDSHMDMPSGVGMPFTKRQPVMFNMHYFNTGATDLHGHVTLNLEFTKGAVQPAGSFISFNTQINVPANGAQTVSGHCTPPAGAQFFLMSTHTHSHAVDANINRYANGQVGEQLVKTTDWEHPTVEQYDAPFVTFAPGEDLFYSCDYQNDTATTLTVGESALKNEMCMAVTYYFPATTGAFCR